MAGPTTLELSTSGVTGRKLSSTTGQVLTRARELLALLCQHQLIRRIVDGVATGDEARVTGMHEPPIGAEQTKAADSSATYTDAVHADTRQEGRAGDPGQAERERRLVERLQFYMGCAIVP